MYQTQRPGSSAMTRITGFYIGLVVAVGSITAAAAVQNWSCPDPFRFQLFAVLTALASLVKLRIPGIEGTHSLNSVVLLAGMVDFTWPEAVAAAGLAVAIQQFVRTTVRPSPAQVCFNLSNEAFSVAAGAWTAALVRGHLAGLPDYLVIAIVAAVYFVLNTVIVSGVLSLLQSRPLRSLWQQWYYWSFPFYLTGSVAVALFPGRGAHAPMESWVVLIPLLYLLHFFAGLSLSPTRPGAGGTANGEARLGLPARIYIGAVTAMGLAAFTLAALRWRSDDPVHLAGVLLLSALAATWKVRLPMMTGAIAVNFVPALYAVAVLSLPETLVAASVGAMVQSLYRPARRPQTVQVLFNVCCLALSSALAYLTFHGIQPLAESTALALGAAAIVQYGVNTLLVAVVLCLVEGKPVSRLWSYCCFWSLPYYMAGAAAAGVMAAAQKSAGWWAVLAIVPLLALMHLTYRLHMNRAAEHA